MLRGTSIASTCSSRSSISGYGLSRARHRAVPNHIELLSHIYEKLGWKSDEFRLYRCGIDYPIYGVQAALAFDPPFAASIDDAGSAGRDGFEFKVTACVRGGHRGDAAATPLSVTPYAAFLTRPALGTPPASVGG